MISEELDNSHPPFTRNSPITIEKKILLKEKEGKMVKRDDI